MQWLGWAALYLGGHLLFYVLVLRHLRWFSREKIIFLYHLVSTLALAGVLLLALAGAPRSTSLSSVVAAMSLHGIYSLSFLEFWSLAEGSYSLSILRHMEIRRAAGKQLDISSLLRIADKKKEGRIDNLQRLLLVRRKGEQLALTVFGRLASFGLRIIAWAVNAKKVK